MDENLPSKLIIVTSALKAVEIYPLTRGAKYEERNSFLNNFRIEFHKPNYSRATLNYLFTVPIKESFSLFEENEKEILMDEYTFYGIEYKTTVKQAKRRVDKVVEKLESKLGGAKKASQPSSLQIMSQFSERDKFKDIGTALKELRDKDEITLVFMFAEWPNPEEARKRDYVREFEDKILSVRNNPDDDLPF